MRKLFTPLLVVTAQVTEKMEQAGDVVVWRGPEDDDRLGDALRAHL